MTSEEVRKKLGYFGTSGNAQFTDHSFLYEAVKSMVEQKQKEAYNQALEDAAENVEIEVCDEYQGNQFSCLRVNKQSILKLKK